MLFPPHCRSYRIITPQSRVYLPWHVRRKKSPISGEEEDLLDWGEDKEIKLILYFMNGEMNR